ncbi:MAG: T9SS type A sorting domain-containing protein [Bacteroidota bacterium]
MKSFFALLATLLIAQSTAFAQNQNLSNGFIFEGEPYLAVNPSNPQHLVVAWMGFVFQQPVTMKTRVTFDGGQSWSTTVNLPHFSTTWGSADPSIQFDAAGDVFVCYVDFSEPDSGAIYTLKSTDGGLSWGNPVVALDIGADGGQRPIDRPWFTIDRSTGPYRDHQYLTTMPPQWVALPKRSYFVRSTTGGTAWEPWRYLDTLNYLVGPAIASPMPAPAVSADGTFHAIYPSWETSQNLFPGYFHASSTDGGASFSYHDVYFGLFNPSDSLAKKGYRLATDPSDPDHLALLMVADLSGDLDVYLLESTDAGQNWTAPLRVNDDPAGTGVLQDLVWADFDRDGDLIVTWRDRRSGNGSGYAQASEIWGAVRWKDSTNFAPNFPISDLLSVYDTTYGPLSGNDFMGSVLVDDTLSAVWGDVRQGRLNIYFSRIALGNMTTALEQQIGGEELPELHLFPNPTDNRIELRGDWLHSAELIGSNGQKLGSWKIEGPTFAVPLENCPAGTYFLRVQTNRGMVAKKLVKQ